jgi:uncharacterized protein YkwD
VALPSLRALFAVSAMLAVAAAAPAVWAGSERAHRGAAQLTRLESGVLQQINFIRTEHRLVPLHINARLSEAAAEHSEELGADGYFDHASPDGSAFWRRIERFYPQGSHRLWAVGENILWSSPRVSPAAAMQLWMHSPDHRANILDARWHEIGVAAVHFAHASGLYKGRAVTIVTTDFGVRK